MMEFLLDVTWFKTRLVRHMSCMALLLDQCAMLSRHERNNKFSDTGPQTGSNGLTELTKWGHNAYRINPYKTIINLLHILSIMGM